METDTFNGRYAYYLENHTLLRRMVVIVIENVIKMAMNH